MLQLYLRLLSKKSVAIILVVVLAACTDEKPANRSYPVVNTYETADVTELGATLRGEILNLGDGALDHGFIYSRYEIYSDNPNTERLSLGERLTTGEFTGFVTHGLEIGKTYYYRAYAVSKTKGMMTLGQQFSFVSKGSSAPVIRDFFPKQASIYDTITIVGTGFSSILTNNSVRFGENITSVLSVNGDTLRVVVPPTSTLAEVSLTVEVSKQKIQSTEKFKLLPITVTSFEPTVATYGDVITIHGTNLPLSYKASFLSILGEPVTFISSTRTELKVQVGLELTELISQVKITFGVQSFDLPDPVKLLPLEIKSFDPTEGRGEVTVTIEGQGFNPLIENNAVWFGEQALILKGEVLMATNNYIVVKAPNFYESTVPIIVRSSIQTATSTDNFHCRSEWKKIADFPGSARDDASAFSVGNFGYVGLGAESEGQAKKFWKYDPANDSWTEVASFPYLQTGGNFRRISTFSNDTYGYVGAGDFAGSNEGMVVRYDPALDKWTYVKDYPVKVRNALGFSVNGKGYVALGSNSSKFSEYDQTSNTWIDKSDFPGTTRTYPNGFSIGSKAYVFSGVAVKDVWELDVDANQWTRKADLDSSIVRTSNFTLNGKAYVVGGSIENKTSAKVSVYDPSSDSWRKIRDFPGGPREAAVVFTIGNKAYVGTGRAANNALFQDFYEFDPQRLPD